MRFFFIATFVLFIGGCSTNPSFESFTKSQDKLILLNANQNAESTVKSGDLFLIEAESNPSTGYRWVIVNRKQLSKCMQIVKEQIFPTQIENGRVGTPGKQQWQIKTSCPVVQEVQFEYRRSWEAVSTKPAARMTLRLNIVGR